MPDDIENLLAAAQRLPRSARDVEEQRRSFAYGNAHIENENVTRKMIDDAAAKVGRHE